MDSLFDPTLHDQHARVISFLEGKRECRVAFCLEPFSTFWSFRHLKMVHRLVSDSLHAGQLAPKRLEQAPVILEEDSDGDGVQASASLPLAVEGKVRWCSDQ